MTFFRRLRLYLFGALLGILLVIFFFGDRLRLLTSWLPNNQVLLRLQMTETLYEPHALCKLECLDLDTADVSSLQKEGDVLFDESDTHSDPIIYIVDSRIHDKLVRMTFVARDSTSTLREVEMPYEQISCDC